jgi:eukaryotic-like serine/threonine-protein kinase
MRARIDVGSDPMPGAAADPGSWGFAEGDQIVAGRSALRRLGGGTRYEVYLAFDERMHAVVVVKILRPDRVLDRTALDGLSGEARALSRLRHPVLVRSFEADVVGPMPHLVLEHVEGPRLSTLLRRHGPLAIEQVLPLGLQLASALHYVAVEGFAHLDVKPSNVIMAGPPRLIDLSIAQTPAEAARHTGPLGTDAYLAPEQVRPERGGIGVASDVWGLGATLYEALAGSVPFPGGARSGTAPREDRFPQLTVDPAPLPAELPRPLTEIVMGCLRRDPAERPTARELAVALEPAVASLPRGLGLRRLIPREAR